MNSPRQLLPAIAALLLIFRADALAGSGGWDRTFAPVVVGGSGVYASAVQPDGRLLVGGAFNSIDGSSSHNNLARLYSDGSLDTSFAIGSSGFSGTIWALALQTNGSVLIGGSFNFLNGSYRYNVARLNSNGTVDGSFVPTNAISGTIYALAIQTNNQVVIGGTFGNGQTFPLNLARLNADGTTDTTFSGIVNGSVNAIAIQPDGKIVIGGAFTQVDGATRYHIARLNADGSLDSVFQNSLSGASSTVRCLQIQGDGKILIGGDFTGVNGSGRGYVARLTTTGTLDTGFGASVGANNSVESLALQPDGSVLIGGLFTTYSGASLSHVARLYQDGTRDTTFTNFGINGGVYTVGLQSDGGILIGGSFTLVNNTNWIYLARLYGNQFPPEFVTQPASLNTNVGANVTFSAHVDNPTPTSFQWLKNGANIPGATGMSYSLFNVQTSDTGNYSVFVTDASGGVTSSNALLQVGLPPVFTSQPTSLTVTQGQSAAFNVVATGTPLYYFWSQNGAVIPGQTNASLLFSSADPTNAGTYTCQVSNFLGKITSTGAVLTVLYPPVITAPPVPQTVGVGSNFTVSVTAAGYPAIGYQWRTNGVPIPGATATNYSVIAAQTNNSGAYDVVITNAVGSITSSIAIISVVYYPPTISQQPVGGNVIVGSNFVLSAAASGTPPFNWQWRTNGIPLAGANGPAYAINGAQLSDAAGYDVVVSAFAGSVTSRVALVNVGFPPVVTQQPVSLTNAVGDTVTFSCMVTGSAPFNLQWTLDGNPLLNATNLALTLTNVQAVNLGNYALAVTNVFGGLTSSNAALNLAGYAFGVWDGLVAYYPFNGNANDASGNGNNGTVSGAALTADRFGANNAAYAFNGVSNEIDIADAAGFDQNQHTLSIWLNASNFSPQGRIGSDVLRKGTIQQWILQLDQSGQIRNEVSTSVSNFVFDSVGTIPTNGWFHVVVVWDGFTNATYLNGIFDSAMPAGGSLVSGTDPVKLGGDQASGQYFQGSLDDVRFYRRALSANDVSNLFALEADLPIVTQPPHPIMVGLGQTATFSVAATANHPLFYQWLFNNAPIAGATNLTLTLTNVQPLNVGSYSVAVSNAFAGVVSAPAALSLQSGVNLGFSVSSGSLNLDISGLPQASYVVEFATNLTPPVYWQPVLTNQTDTNGLWQFSDTNLNFSQKFYRVTTP